LTGGKGIIPRRIHDTFWMDSFCVGVSKALKGLFSNVGEAQEAEPFYTMEGTH